MNRELEVLFTQDRREHAHVPEVGTPEYQLLRERDGARRVQAKQILATLAAPTPEDLYHTAWLLNHGDTPEDAQRAHQLALDAARRGLARARWLAAAAYDRWCMYRGLPQRYGTQIVPDGQGYRLWDADPDTTDAERARWDVPTLAEQQHRAEELSRHAPQPPMEGAPRWLKVALVRWRVGPGDSQG